MQLFLGAVPIILRLVTYILQSTIRAVISTLTCTSMACNSMSDSECYLAVRVYVRVATVAELIVYMRIKVCD